MLGSKLWVGGTLAAACPPLQVIMEREMNITTDWDYEGVTVTGKTDTITVTIDTTGKARIVAVGMPESLADVYDYLEPVAAVWRSEMAVRDTLMAMVQLKPPEGYEWIHDCNEDGLSWHLYLTFHKYYSLVLSVYLETDLSIDRYMPLLVNRYLQIEARRGNEKPTLLERFIISESKGIITMEIVREYMAGDPLNLNGLCKMFDLQYPIT
jgi:hypothetical protein